MDLETRLTLVKLFYSNNESPTATLRAYKRMMSLHNDPFPPSTISRLMQKFEATKTLHDIQSPGRPSIVNERSSAIEKSITNLKAANPLGHTSSRQVARETAIPQRSVVRVLHQIGMHPFRISRTQAISEEDKLKRLDFAKWILENEEILPNILWSDEAYFSLDGLVNRHNCVIWAYENPRCNLPKNLHSPKLCVWMAISSNFKLQPHFFESTVDQENYTSMLRDHLIPELQKRRKMKSVVFQHDGAPPHFSKKARDFLSTKFPENRVIGRGYGHPWPPRSPDLSPLDYYLWGTLKARVYHQFVPRNINELKEKIFEEVQNLETDELQRAINHLLVRAQCVVEADGGLFEHLL